MTDKTQIQTCIAMIESLRCLVETQWNPAHWLLSQGSHNPVDGIAYYAFRAIHTPTLTDLKYRKVEGEASDHVIVVLAGFPPHTLWNCEEWQSLMSLLKPRVAECQSYQEDRRRVEFERRKTGL